MIMSDIRRTEIFVDGKWKESDFEKIRAGDVFRLYESTGEPVEDEKGNSEFVAKTDAYIKDGTYAVDVV